MKCLLGKIEKKLGNMKIGLALLGGGVLVLIFSSFLESYTNASFVDRLIYSTIWFKLLLGSIAFVILISLSSKMPFKKKYLGFYLIHSSLVMILAGGFLTSYTGINGEVVLYPQSFNNQIELNNYELVISSGEDIHNLRPIKTVVLPYNAFAWHTNIEIFPQLFLKSYLPFSKAKPGFGNDSLESGFFSAFIELEGKDQMGDLVLSNHPKSQVPARAVWAGINFTLLPKVMLECFIHNSRYDFFFWNRKEQKCFLPPEKKIKVGVSQLGNRFIEYRDQNSNFTFWPEMSARPMKEHGQVLEDAEIMVMSKKVFENNKDVLLFDNTLMVWSTGQRQYERIELSREWSYIPQMALRIRIKTQSDQQPIINLPETTIWSGVQSSQQAILLQHMNVDNWVLMDQPYIFNHINKIIKISLDKAKAQMPFKIKLKKFEMKLYPESQMPATYQSSVEIEDGLLSDINMNNPLNYKGFRLFQSSYFELSNGEYASVLTASRDPGRFYMYLGSFLFLLGLVYYYYQKRSR